MTAILKSSFLAAALLGATGCASLPAPDPFAWTVGHWHGTRHSGDGGRDARMTVLVERLGDGAGQVECLRVEAPTSPYVGFTITRREESGAWKMIYVNSTEHAFARLEGASSGAKTVWSSVTPGRLRESRLVSERIGDDLWRKTQQYSEDGGATWQVLFTDELERDSGG